MPKEDSLNAKNPAPSEVRREDDSTQSPLAPLLKAMALMAKGGGNGPAPSRLSPTPAPAQTVNELVGQIRALVSELKVKAIDATDADVRARVGAMIREALKAGAFAAPPFRDLRRDIRGIFYANSVLDQTTETLDHLGYLHAQADVHPYEQLARSLISMEGPPAIATPSEAKPPTPKHAPKKLSRCHMVAWGQYTEALGRDPRLQDAKVEKVYRSVQAAVRSHGDEGTLPDSPTWCRYIRFARRHYEADKSGQISG